MLNVADCIICNSFHCANLQDPLSYPFLHVEKLLNLCVISISIDEYKQGF